MRESSPLLLNQSHAPSSVRGFFALYVAFFYYAVLQCIQFVLELICLLQYLLDLGSARRRKVRGLFYTAQNFLLTLSSTSWPS
jgi:hypothetical protein